MAKKKTVGLIDEISSDDFRVDKEFPSWHVRLRKNDEQKYNEIRDVALDFLSCGVVEQKFRTAAALHRFLVARGVLDGISYQQFKDFMSSLKN